jgi:hypothetical protein
MADIFDQDGTRLGAFDLSERQIELLDKDIPITVQYHMPQLLQPKLGQQNGAFSLRRTGSKIVASDPAALKRFLALQLDIRRARDN